MLNTDESLLPFRKGEWYAFGERDNPTLRPHNIDGRRFFCGLVTTIKTKAEASAERYRKRGYFARIIPLVLWGKRRGYAIPEKKRCYVVYHSYNDQKDTIRNGSARNAGTSRKAVK